jgi:Zn-dependent protease with chaperone function
MIVNILMELGLNNFWGYLGLKLGYLALALLILSLVRRMIMGAGKERQYQMMFRYINILLIIGFLVLELKWPLWVWVPLNIKLLPTLILNDIMNLALLIGYLVFFLYQSFLIMRKIRVLQEGFGSYLLQYSYIWLSMLSLIIFLRVDNLYMPMIPRNILHYQQLFIEVAVNGAFILMLGLTLAIRRLRMIGAGPELKELVAEVAGRLGIKVQVVRIWRLDGVKNAFAGGFLRRSIFLSEALVNSTNRDDLRMIVGHECVHLKKRHLWIRAGLIFGWIWLGSEFIDFEEWSALIPFLYAAGVFLIYQFISRRQELEADRLSAMLVGDGKAMATALVRNFGAGQRFGPITRLLAGHPSMEERVERLKVNKG